MMSTKENMTDEVTAKSVTRKRIEHFAVGAAAAATGVVLLAACSSGSSNSTATNAGSSGASSSAASASTKSLKTESTSLGTVAADSSGRTLYELVGDPASNSKCAASCLSIWPAAEVNAKQVVLQGHPAFTFSGDNGSGQVNGQGVKDEWGTWYALDSSGKPIVAKAKAKAKPAGGASSSSTAGGGGGYGY